MTIAAHQLTQDALAAPNRSRKAPTPASARLRGCRYSGMNGSRVTEEVVVRGRIAFITGHSLTLSREEADTIVEILRPFAKPWTGYVHTDAHRHLDHALGFLEHDEIDAVEALHGLIDFMRTANLWTTEEAVPRARYEQEAATAFRRDLGEHVDPDDDPAIDADVIPWRGRLSDEA